MMILTSCLLHDLQQETWVTVIEYPVLTSASIFFPSTITAVIGSALFSVRHEREPVPVLPFYALIVDDNLDCCICDTEPGKLPLEAQCQIL
ncbi:hypothetical protein E2C01_073767 [Portunus trituberculatus]|uniref:Uncharacterized protein n=1 Tax=Portunus trituberculatus TaxID=210409 RepID=A0A5B7I1L5_PORTR|nr:hypothetical protein [Portunus trituberculatus]